MKYKIITLLIIFFPTIVFAEDLEKYVQEHFNKIYKQINNLNYQSSIFLDLKSEIDELRNQNQILRQQIETLNQKLSNFEKNYLNNYNSFSEFPNGDNDVKTLSSTSTPESDKRSLAQAKVLLRNKANDQAIKLLEALTVSTNQDIALESQYWLGVSYVTKNECQRARPYLTNFYNTAPNHEFAPEAILANAICERESGNQANYQAAIKLLKNQYPDSRAAKSLP